VDWEKSGRWDSPPIAAPTPTYDDRIVWAVVKGERRAEARVRVVPHGHELRILADGELITSCVYRAAESPELGTASTGWLQAFQAKGWRIVNAGAPTS